MNNLSIFIDIDQEFDKVLNTIAMAGLAGKVYKVEKYQRRVDKATNDLIKATAGLEALENRLTTDTTVLDNFKKAYFKHYKNMSIRKGDGTFTSTRHELLKNSNLVNEKNYKIIDGIRAKLNPEAQATLDDNMYLFTYAHEYIVHINKEIIDIRRKVDVGKDVVAKTKAENAELDALIKPLIDKTKAQLRKLGYVAIMKILKDIEKKAKRA